MIINIFKQKLRNNAACGIIQLFIICILLGGMQLMPLKVIAQSSSTLSGYIKDINSGEEMIGASIYVEELQTGCVTNTYGFYSLTIPSGTYTLQVRFIGYKTLTKKVKLEGNVDMDFRLLSSSEQLEEVVISGEKGNQQHIQDTRTSIVKLKPAELRSVPILFGEQDIIKTLQLEGGVKAGNEGMAGMFVRGGKGDENLILLDEAPVYNAAHAGGLFSVFNSDAIKDATLIKGNFPSNYGGRLSSVLDVKMKEGNNQKFHMEGGIGLISSRITLESPIVKGKSSFMISGRRTYLDVVARPLMDKEDRDNGFYFYDLNAKVNTWLGKKDRIFASGYFGRDIFKVEDAMNLNWGNKTGTLRWNHVYNSKLFSNVSLIFSKYDYSLKTDEDEYDEEEIPELRGGIEDINLKTSFHYYLNPDISFNFGVDGIFHKFHPGRLVFNEYEVTSVNREFINAMETSAFISAKIKLLPTLNIEPGIRYANFSVVGPFETKTQIEGQTTSVEKYSSGELVKMYHSPEPRISLTYVINEHNSIKASYSRNTQFYHILKTTSASNPMDVWYPATKKVTPSSSNQYILGYFHNFKGGKWSASVETYYKTFEGVKELSSGTDIFQESLEPNILEGKGYAYGIEFSVRKEVGKLSGWANYTYSRVFHQVDQFNNGKWYPGAQDRPHDISVVLMYKINKRMEIGTLWTYQTGQVYTQPQQMYSFEGMCVPMYSEINGARFEDYHRLDFNFTYYPKRTANRRWKQYWTFSLYNAYGKHNTFLLQFDNVRHSYNDGSNARKATSIAFFKFVPAITYNFKF